MLKISKKSQYGLRAIAYLAKCRDRICPLKEISKKEDIPFEYLGKIVSKLEKSGLLKGKKGVQGGYSLAKSPSKIKLGEIIKSLEGELVLVQCIAKAEKCVCPRSRICSTKSFWKKIQDSLNYNLNSLTLADLIKK